jgi:hypothetical protein
MTSEIERLRRLALEAAAERRKDPETTRVIERVRQQARSDVPEWTRLIEQRIKNGGPFVYLHERNTSFNWYRWLTGDSTRNEPNLNRAFLLLHHTNKELANLAGKAYAEELGAILGPPFEVTFQEGGFAGYSESAGPADYNGVEMIASITVSWPYR